MKKMLLKGFKKYIYIYTTIGWLIWTYPRILKKKNIYIYTPSFHGTHVTRYIKFKLLYKFIILTLFFFKYMYNTYIIENWIFKIIFWILMIFIVF